MDNIPTRRAALYVRVSTDRQTAENQIAEVRQLVAARGYEPVIYEEVESAAKARPVLDRMLGDVRAGRVHRGLGTGPSPPFDDGRDQHRPRAGCLGAPVLSVREGWLDTSGPVRPLLVAIFGWVAEQERTRLIERTKAGLERARREGKAAGAAEGVRAQGGRSRRACPRRGVHPRSRRGRWGEQGDRAARRPRRVTAKGHRSDPVEAQASGRPRRGQRRGRFWAEVVTWAEVRSRDGRAWRCLRRRSVPFFAASRVRRRRCPHGHLDVSGPAPDSTSDVVLLRWGSRSRRTRLAVLGVHLVRTLVGIHAAPASPLGGHGIGVYRAHSHPCGLDRECVGGVRRYSLMPPGAFAAL
ncbi:hypothetical protein AMOR_05510 [Anaeromyxobacter oryzae]|uniref:Resolvase/invertase-type recombinase catalytic domain-containing protein n=1 Tax=Anaeromyxobacter oryzae TaxID=2918170 RepID=A0ABM7WQ13_9BACT|nr:hypothetical protein AMOR_05510 [Anaeromyxobacter oryzae]